MTHTPKDSKRLVLASASPRRASLLTSYGYAFDVLHPPIDEPDHMGLTVPTASQAEALSYFKARSVQALVDEGIIIGADTIAVAGTRTYGKPVDRDDARAILLALVGTTHEVVTGVTLLNAETGRRLIQHEATAVTMRPMTNAQIEEYLDGKAWVGKAGAYGIQDHGDTFVERIHGSYTNIVGLPMELLGRMLAEWGCFPVEHRRPERAET